MRTVLLLVGIAAILCGGLWVGQGAGYIHWPASSFMINVKVWEYYGAALAFIGLLCVYFARR